MKSILNILTSPLGLSAKIFHQRTRKREKISIKGSTEKLELKRGLDLLFIF